MPSLAWLQAQSLANRARRAPAEQFEPLVEQAVKECDGLRRTDPSNQKALAMSQALREVLLVLRTPPGAHSLESAAAQELAVAWCGCVLRLLDQGHRLQQLCARVWDVACTAHAGCAQDVLRLVAWHADHAAVAAYLLDQGGADPNQADNDGTTPLYIASYKGHVEVARLLLDKGADPNQADNDGTTPLYMASQEGHVEVARLLEVAMLLKAKGAADLR